MSTEPKFYSEDVKSIKSVDIKNGINLKNNFIQTFDNDGNIILYNTNGICLSLQVYV